MAGHDVSPVVIFLYEPVRLVLLLLLRVPGLNINDLTRPPPWLLPDCLLSLLTPLLNELEWDTVKVAKIMDTIRSSNSLDMFEATDIGVEAFQIDL